MRVSSHPWPGIILYFIISFVLHFLWEKLQMPLYAVDWSFWECTLRCLYATATGDMAFMAVIYFALAFIHQDLFWVMDAKAFRHPATWVIAALLGLMLGTGFELWAVYVDHRWVYSALMPMVPVVQVGLSPVLQMTLIPMAVLLTLRKSIAR